MSDKINIGNIDGTKVLNQIPKEVIIVLDISVLFNNISARVTKDKITIIKLEYFFIINYMI